MTEQPPSYSTTDIPPIHVRDNHRTTTVTLGVHPYSPSTARSSTTATTPSYPATIATAPFGNTAPFNNTAPATSSNNPATMPFPHFSATFRRSATPRALEDSLRKEREEVRQWRKATWRSVCFVSGMVGIVVVMIVVFPFLLESRGFEGKDWKEMGR